jgi:hypothetical protein
MSLPNISPEDGNRFRFRNLVSLHGDLLPPSSGLKKKPIRHTASGNQASKYEKNHILVTP